MKSSTTTATNLQPCLETWPGEDVLWKGPCFIRWRLGFEEILVPNIKTMSREVPSKYLVYLFLFFSSSSIRHAQLQK